ncbi:cytochrome c class I [Tolypothrix tenuis PCC 7101]|uniref:Cytochrome c6 n=1 Tax=Tolypothrix tenuis PCC 7101 TaxID=231146 RepID=A0A1Z4N848_9CYAN|nr:c-type cytochrome [Aulosira sp. FACHB-113]BAZ01904.1 cytochrome c class I [Tolypothrix tenuis PCC 7101]BAZ74171.1 cytochrome c class I [Aulosira laxa NIES-50]
MKKFFSIVLLGIAIFTFAFSKPALAADSASGAKVFSANCASCHAGGKNLVQANKNLQKDALEKYGMYSADAIIAQVTNGKNAMPAFKGRLKANQIEDVAAYVLESADKGWKKS